MQRAVGCLDCPLSCTGAMRAAPHPATRPPCPPPQELERLTSSVHPVLRSLLGPHLEDLCDKMQPGLLVLTWTSVNIDGYLHRFHQVRVLGRGCAGWCRAGRAAGLLG